MNTHRTKREIKTKDTLIKLSENKWEFSANDLIELAGDAVTMIEDLEYECMGRYNEGVIYGMERMAEILRGERE